MLPVIWGIRSSDPHSCQQVLSNPHTCFMVTYGGKVILDTHFNPGKQKQIIAVMKRIQT
jgi:hypothetical protein